MARIVVSDEVAAVSATGDASEETVLTSAAAVMKATAIDEDGEFSSRAAPMIKSLLAESGTVESASAVEEAQMPQVSGTVDGRMVALSAAGEDSLAVAIDGTQTGTIDFEIGREMHGHAIVSPGVRILTPFFNMYGLLTLVGGAIYSAYIFLRKRIMPNRVLGNVLIASGALMPGIGGFMSRLGMGGYLYLGELLGAILMFAGFVAATNKPQTVKAPMARAAEAQNK